MSCFVVMFLLAPVPIIFRRAPKIGDDLSEDGACGSHLRLIVMARRRLDGIVSEYAGNSENMLRVLSGEGGGGTVAEEVRVNPLSCLTSAPMEQTSRIS